MTAFYMRFQLRPHACEINILLIKSSPQFPPPLVNYMVCVCTHATWHTWRSEDNFRESVLFFTMWVPEMEPRPRALTHRAISTV